MQVQINDQGCMLIQTKKKKSLKYSEGQSFALSMNTVRLWIDNVYVLQFNFFLKFPLECLFFKLPVFNW